MNRVRKRILALLLILLMVGIIYLRITMQGEEE